MQLQVVTCNYKWLHVAMYMQLQVVTCGYVHAVTGGYMWLCTCSYWWLHVAVYMQLQVVTCGYVHAVTDGYKTSRIYLVCMFVSECLSNSILLLY